MGKFSNNILFRCWQSFWQWQHRYQITVNVVWGSILVLSLVLYVGQINAVATKGHQIKELEKTLATEKQKQYVYSVQSAELRSMDRIEKGIAALNLRQANEKEYIVINGGNVLAKK